MFESGTWRIRPGERFTFGRAPTCTAILPPLDRGVSRTAGSMAWTGGLWWLANDSAASMLYLSGDLGFRVDLPPGMRIPVQQWHAKVRLDGLLGSYTLRLRLPDLDGNPDDDLTAESSEPRAAEVSSPSNPRLITSTRNRAPLSETDRLVLAARFEEYLTWRYAGEPAPRSARDAAERIGWPPHRVTKRCENIRNRYARHGVAGLRGRRALEELAMLLISTGELTAADLRLLPGRAPV